MKHFLKLCLDWRLHSSRLLFFYFSQFLIFSKISGIQMHTKAQKRENLLTQGNKYYKRMIYLYESLLVVSSVSLFKMSIQFILSHVFLSL